jgi:hypothetical protein
LDELREQAQGARGIYVLYFGIMPVFIGEGDLGSRLKTHSKKGAKRRFWDRFSWFTLQCPEQAPQFEAILLQCLPYCLRADNRRGAELLARPIEPNRDPAVFVRIPESIRELDTKRKHKKRT